MQTTQAAFVMEGHRLALCSEIAPLLVFYPCDELGAPEKRQIDAHLATCLSCAQQLREEQEIHATPWSLFAAGYEMDPSEELLAQCRRELCELLDDFSVSRVRGHASPSGWARRRMAQRPMFG